MSRYDTTFIVNPQIGDDNINASVNAITEIITSSKGEVLRERRIGARRLAYQIDRQTHGYYVSLIHDCDANVLPKLERHFKLGDNYLRDLTIRYDGDPFRKSITDVMMGADSDERRPVGDRDSDDDRRPAAAKPPYKAPVAAKVETPKAAETSPAAATPPVVETPPVVATPPVAETPPAAATEEETL